MRSDILKPKMEDKATNLVALIHFGVSGESVGEINRKLFDEILPALGKKWRDDLEDRPFDSWESGLPAIVCIDRKWFENANKMGMGITGHAWLKKELGPLMDPFDYFVSLNLMGNVTANYCPGGDRYEVKKEEPCLSCPWLVYDKEGEVRCFLWSQMEEELWGTETHHEEGEPLNPFRPEVKTEEV